MSHSETQAGGAGVGAWRATFAAMCALFVGIGLARFAYSPLIPALVNAGWFSAGDAAYLGAANLAGYLVGALLARTLTKFARAPALLRFMSVLATVSFFACVAPVSFSWFFLWRFAAGFAGAVLMVLAAPLVLPHVPAARRGLAGGIIMTGVAFGIAGSGSLVPLLLQWGLAATWSGLGALALALTLVAWRGWPQQAAPAMTTLERRGAAWHPALLALYVGYALNAAGLVPHMVFLVDFVARGLGRGIDAGAHYWVLFGLGALCGPVILGWLADRTGFVAAVRLAYIVQAFAVAAPAVATATVALVLSSVVAGLFVPGITALVLGRARELAGPDIATQQSAWSIATTAWALGQAAAAYGCSFLIAASGSYALLFALGAGAIGLALALDAVPFARAAAMPPSPPRRRWQVRLRRW